ncbi:hypothetical protein ACFLXE_00350 [Chloroflexota bacterium]
MKVFGIELSRKPKKVTSPTGKRVETEEHGRSGKDTYSDDYFRRYASWLGQFDPQYVSLSTMKKMRTHPAIALGLQLIDAPLVNAKWDIQCADPFRKEFVRAVMEPLYTKLMLYALTSVEFGFAGFTKQWAAEIPYKKDGTPAWTNGAIKPLVIKKLKQLDPETVKPYVISDEFKGMYQNAQLIDPLYSAWITHARHKVFGNLWGWPLLINAYKLWWSSSWRYALRDRHIEDRVSPPLLMRHPRGSYDDPTSGVKKQYQDAALVTGKAIRAGETVAMTSERVGEDEDKPGTDYKWNAEYLQGGENIQAFIDLDDADDVRILMSLLIPPQAVLKAKGGLGSQDVAESLGNLFWETEVIRKQELDDQLTDYVVQPLVDLNFGSGPKAKLVTTGFLRTDRELVTSVLRIVANRQDIDPSRLFNLPEMVRQLDLPISEETGPLTKLPLSLVEQPDWVKPLNDAMLREEFVSE